MKMGEFPETSNKESVLELLEKTLEYARERDYTGYDRFDGISSRILQSLPIDNKYLNAAFQQGVKKAPINLRPWLLVEQRQSYKGTALFAMANIITNAMTGKRLYADEAVDLANWLINNQSTMISCFAGGHQHALQGYRRKTPPNHPDVVSTSYAVKALLTVREVFDISCESTIRSAADFLFAHLDYRVDGNQARIKYRVGDTDEWYTINSNALGARMLLDLYAAFEEERCREGATKILNYVVSKQTDVGGWYYRDPPSASSLSMDNYHNGFIIETLVQYRDQFDTDEYDDAISDALEFYFGTLFEDTGAPNWDENHAYPKDIHSLAQGLVVSSMVERFDWCERILSWGIAELYAGDGRFLLDVHRSYRRSYTLMRWCQAWMAYGLAAYVGARFGCGGPAHLHTINSR